MADSFTRQASDSRVVNYYVLHKNASAHINTVIVPLHKLQCRTDVCVHECLHLALRTVFFERSKSWELLSKPVFTVLRSQSSSSATVFELKTVWGSIETWLRLVKNFCNNTRKQTSIHCVINHRGCAAVLSQHKKTSRYLLVEHHQTSLLRDFWPRRF